MRVSVLTSIVAILATTTALPILQEETEVSVSVNEQAEGWLSTVKDSVTTLLGLEETKQPCEIEDPDTYWKHYGKQQRKYWKHYGKEQKKKWTPKTPEDGEDDGYESLEESQLVEDPAKKWKKIGKHWKHFGKDQKKKWAPKTPEDDEPEDPSDVETMGDEIEDPDYWKHYGKQQRKYWKHYGKEQKKKWTPKTPEDDAPEDPSDVESMGAEIEDPDYWKHYGKQQKKYWKHYGKDQKKKWTPKTPEDGNDDDDELFEESELAEDPAKKWKHYGKQWKHYGKQWKKKAPTGEAPDMPELPSDDEFESFEVVVEDPAKKWKKIGKHWKHFGKDQKKKWAPKTPEDDAPEDPSDVETMGDEIEDPDYWKHYGKQQKKYWKHYGKDQKKKWTPKTPEDGDDESFQLVNQA